jgi:hypothetical protein
MNAVTQHVVMFSAGAGSWGTAEAVRQRHGREHLRLVFTDTLTEDADAYRFLIEGAAHTLGYAGLTEVSGLAARATVTPPAWERVARKAHILALRMDVQCVMPRLVWLADGRDIWDVFQQVRFLGNSGKDPCSRALKRELADRWRTANCDPARTIGYVGIDWTEEHRFVGVPGDPRKPGLRALMAAKGWRYEAPLCEPPYRTKADILDDMRRVGIRPPRLYELGFAHNNCGGGCVKAGIGHFAHLRRALPHVFAHWERMELELREQLGDVAMLEDRRGGVRRPLPLFELRNRIESGQEIDQYEIGGCGCFIDTEAA